MLLCDEVTSALDRTVAQTVLDLLDELSNDLGVTLVVIAHDSAVTERLGGEVVTIANGRLTHGRDAEMSSDAWIDDRTVVRNLPGTSAPTG